MPRDPREKVLSWEAAVEARRSARTRGRRVVFTNGCFDVLHPGHVLFLAEARALGDLLLVGLNSDCSVRGLKGPRRPAVPEGDRALILAALESVDGVILFDDPTPQKLIVHLAPDILVKGGEYALDEIVGRREVEAAGGKVVTLPMIPGYSTTHLLEALRASTDVSPCGEAGRGGA